MFDDDEYNYTPKAKEIKVMKNGDCNSFTTIRVSKNSSIQDLIKQITDKMPEFKNSKLIRLFTDAGVELLQDDIEFIKNGSQIYISKGEQFDQYSTFSEYEMKEQLGEGGFGKVMLGVHRQTQEKVAIKLVNTSLIGNAQDIDMVFREAEMLKALNHKNIVKIKNCYCLDNMQVVFVMEFLEGGELLDYVSNQEYISEEQARIFFKQICEAINYCHKEKLIHRDLKLENVMLVDKQSDKIKVVDFGIAGICNNFNPENIDAGSLRYMAPEILLKKPKAVAPPLDIWAMGCILYAMTCGNLPFLGNNTKQIMEAICSAKYQYPPNLEKKISKELKDLLARIFQVEPSQRITMKEIQDHPWTLNKKLEGDFKQIPEIIEETKQEDKIQIKINVKKSVDKKEVNSPKLRNVSPTKQSEAKKQAIKQSSFKR